MNWGQIWGRVGIKEWHQLFDQILQRPEFLLCRRHPWKLVSWWALSLLWYWELLVPGKRGDWPLMLRQLAKQEAALISCWSCFLQMHQHFKDKSPTFVVAGLSPPPKSAASFWVITYDLWVVSQKLMTACRALTCQCLHWTALAALALLFYQ